MPSELRYNLSPVSGSVLGMTWTCAPGGEIKRSRGKRLLSDKQVGDAKARYACGETLQQIGSAFGVSHRVIHYAIRGGLLSDVSAPVVGIPKRKRTPEMRARMSEAGKRRPPMSAETREKLRVANLGRVMSEEWRAKIGSVAKGRRYSPEVCAQRSAAKKAAYAADPDLRIRIGNARRGQTLTPEMRLRHTEVFQNPEVRARMSAAHKGRPWTEAQRAARVKQAIQ